MSSQTTSLLKSSQNADAGGGGNAEDSGRVYRGRSVYKEEDTISMTHNKGINTKMYRYKYMAMGSNNMEDKEEGLALQSALHEISDFLHRIWIPRRRSLAVFHRLGRDPLLRSKQR